MANRNSSKKPFLIPILLVIAIVIILGMLRLGVWQLDRASQKQVILDQVRARETAEHVSPADLLTEFAPQAWHEELRFRRVAMTGNYLADQSILIENQVRNQRGGYLLITPFKADSVDSLLLVNRGWLPAGSSRQDLPEFDTPEGSVSIQGRLNIPPSKPPIWNDDYPVNEGTVWQYLPIDKFSAQLQESVLPLVVELAPENEGSQGLEVHWQQIDDDWVATHKGYAFQWFAMAAALFIICLLLTVRSFAKPKNDP